MVFDLKGLSQRRDLLYEIGVRDDHSAAAVSLDTEVIENLLGVLSHVHALLEFGICRTNDLSACEASDGYDHMISP